MKNMRFDIYPSRAEPVSYFDFCHICGRPACSLVVMQSKSLHGAQELRGLCITHDQQMRQSFLNHSALVVVHDEPCEGGEIARLARSVFR